MVLAADCAPQQGPGRRMPAVAKFGQRHRGPNNFCRAASTFSFHLQKSIFEPSGVGGKDVTRTCFPLGENVFPLGRNVFLLGENHFPLGKIRFPLRGNMCPPADSIDVRVPEHTWSTRATGTHRTHASPSPAGMRRGT